MALTFTGETAFDVKANNAVVNAMLCTVSTELMVVNDRVADELGGTCGEASPLATDSAPAPAAESTATATAESTATTEATATATATTEAEADTATAESTATARRL